MKRQASSYEIAVGCLQDCETIANSVLYAIVRLSAPEMNFAIALKIRIRDYPGCEREGGREGRRAAWRKLTRRAAFIQGRRELKRGAAEEAAVRRRKRGMPEGSRSILVIHSGMVYSLILPPSSISWTRISRASRRGPGYE